MISLSATPSATCGEAMHSEAIVAYNSASAAAAALEAAGAKVAAAAAANAATVALVDDGNAVLPLQLKPKTCNH